LYSWSCFSKSVQTVSTGLTSQRVTLIVNLKRPLKTQTPTLRYDANRLSYRRTISYYFYLINSSRDCHLRTATSYSVNSNNNSFIQSEILEVSICDFRSLCEQLKVIIDFCASVKINGRHSSDARIYSDTQLSKIDVTHLTLRVSVQIAWLSREIQILRELHLLTF
jgi:hypothetical protein